MLEVYIYIVLKCMQANRPKPCVTLRTYQGGVVPQRRRSFYAMKEYAKGFYKSAAWKACRASYAASRAGLCEICLQHGLYVPGEIVHHKVHITPANINDPAVTLNWGNLQLVCRDCHAQLHGDKVPTRYRIDANGRVLVPPLSKK